MNIKELLIEEEGFRLRPYRCPEGKLTIGVGRNLDDVGISIEEAEYLLDNDIDKAKAAANRLVDNFHLLSDTRKDALTSMVFQMGEHGVSQFKNMILAINTSKFDTAAIEMLDSRWATQTPERANRHAEMMKDG